MLTHSEMEEGVRKGRMNAHNSSAERIGVVIACHNPGERLLNCLEAVFRSTIVEQLHVVVIDDGSTDGSISAAQKTFPAINVLVGSGNLWWAGACNLGIEACLGEGCLAIVLLNPDVLVSAQAFEFLWEASKAKGAAIVAPLVLDGSNPELIWEAGHSWEPVLKWLPILWRSRYLYPHHSPASRIPVWPYPTVSIVGRGGLFPRTAFNALGLLDAKHFPQYGADAVMGVMAWRAGYPMYIVPAARVYVDCRQTGMMVGNNKESRIRSFTNYLFKRKNGERLRVLWFQSIACVPWYAVVPNYIFWVALNTLRYWQGVWRSACKA